MPFSISLNIVSNEPISASYASTPESLSRNGMIIAMHMPVVMAITTRMYSSSLYVTLKLSMSTCIVCLNLINASFMGLCKVGTAEILLRVRKNYLWQYHAQTAGKSKTVCKKAQTFAVRKSRKSGDMCRLLRQNGLTGTIFSTALPSCTAR